MEIMRIKERGGRYAEQSGDQWSGYFEAPGFDK